MDDQDLPPVQTIPRPLCDLKQWLVWRFEPSPDGAKPRKVPYYVSGARRTGTQGDDRDRRRLATYEAAAKALDTGKWEGLGFAFLPGDGLIGIDIDGAIDIDTGEISQRCRDIVAACNSYTEFSPSGRGVHIFVLGETQTFKSNEVGVEVFCGSQFFTWTGKVWPGASLEVGSITDQTLARLRATVESGKQKPTAPGPVRAPQARDDFQRINAMALAVLEAWVPSLFPTARKTAAGFRVKQKDLGRDLQEDLSITSRGIKDFGVADLGDPKAGGRTPIDLVVEWRGLQPKEALHWLAGQLGVRLEPLAAPARSASQAAGAPAAQPAAAATASTPPASSAAEGVARPRPSGVLRALLLQGAQGGVKACRENVYLCLQHHDELKGLVAYDEFGHRVMKRRNPPWGGGAGEWSTNDDFALGYFLAIQEGFTVSSDGALVAGVGMAAWENRYHPVREYLDALPAWDGVERLAFWLHECLGAADTTYSRLVGTWFLMGMVKRVLEPGCQMDYMVVLEGTQGKRKSTALRTLVGNDAWFADTPIRIGDKDAMLSLAGKWLYEVGELDSFNRAEVTAVKQYVSSRVDRVREPFARRHADRPRSGVFAGTTNQSEYFKDPTGARRFWSVACDGDINVEKLAEWRAQLFAEALARLQDSDAERRRYYPTREETLQYLVPEQEKREIGDPWFERIAFWVDSGAKIRDTMDVAADVDSFTTNDILTLCLGVPQDRIDGARQMATRVGIAMHKLGWEKRRDASGPRLWRYWRPERKPTEGGGNAA